MDSVDIEELLEDSTSSSGSDCYGSLDLKNVYQQVVTTRQMKKMYKNAHYGKSVMQSREEKHFRNAVDEIRNTPNGRVFNAREVRGFRDLFLNALRHIEENHFSTDGYKWFLHMETMDMVRHLFDDHFVNSGQTTGINPDNYSIHGVEFVMTTGIPEGRIILADEEFIKRDPIRPHAMALIENATDGFPTEIGLNIGGEMELYTIQK